MTNQPHPPKRTQTDLFRRFLEELGGTHMRESFDREVLPHVHSGPWDEEVSEVEFQQGVAHIREEAPAFARWLETAELRPLPDDWPHRGN